MTVTPNDVLRFLLELAGVVSAGYWGFTATEHPTARLVLALAAPLALIAFWAVVVAPAAANPLRQDHRFLLGSGVLLLAALGLAAAGPLAVALAFAALIVANTVQHFVR